MLPYRFGNWTLEKNWDNQHPDTCRLISEKIVFNDGYDTSDLRVDVQVSALTIYTGSNIDLSYENSGLQLGSSALIPFSGLKGTNNVVINGDFSARLLDVDSMTVKLGFWPTWPVTQTQQIQIPLSDFPAAVSALLDCKTL